MIFATWILLFWKQCVSVLSQQAYILYGISKWGPKFLFSEDFNLLHYYLKLTSERGEREKEKEREREREREKKRKNI